MNFGNKFSCWQIYEIFTVKPAVYIFVIYFSNVARLILSNFVTDWESSYLIIFSILSQLG